MATLTHLMIHCSYTKAGKNFKASDILKWHLGPKDVFDAAGKRTGVVYKGKTYKDRMYLPVESVSGEQIMSMKGNGWSVPGYSDVIELNGHVASMMKYNNDDNVDPWEITNGAVGWNNHARHVCLIGGMGEDGKSTVDNFTSPQWVALEAYISATIADHPNIKLIGHNQVTAKKDCPGFNVPMWARKRGFNLKNVDFHNYGGNTHFKFLNDD